jgi:3-methyl-2-oxobutanoate hydroxymethyltransferase
MNIHDFKTMKENQQKISMVTCYDYWSAKIINQTEVDCLLVGDSAAMTMHGYDTTLPANIDMLQLHTLAVKKGAPDKFIVADMPFLSFRKGLSNTMNNVEKLIQAGAHAIKLEGIYGNETTINYIAKSGVPVMGHLGLTPQSIHQLGGFKVQGRSPSIAKILIEQAKLIEEYGCFSMVLECIPNNLAEKITETVSIPTIGIGAGHNVDGQILVFQDLLGLNLDFKPKFVKAFLDGKSLIIDALNTYVRDVKYLNFPSQEYSFEE